MSSENAGGPNVVTTPEDTAGGLRVHADKTASLQGYGPTYEDIITTKALEVYDSGTIFTLNLVDGFTVTLPTIAQVLASNSGCWSAEFWVKTAPTTAYIITEDTSADTNVLIGSAGANETDTNSDDDYSAAFTQVNFVASNAVVGDWVRIWSDGIKFYVFGNANVRAGITLS